MPDATSNPAFMYRAFISYSHADKAWTDWLHKALETYRVPSRLVGKQTAAGIIPRRLNPIFRDRDDLASAHDLGNKVNEALGKSAALIVICSPRSATSRWVNDEVLAFKRLGRTERIFCLIVDGEPNATDIPGRDAEECFAQALRFQLGSNGQPNTNRTEPIAADARPDKDGKANSKLKLIAGLLDVGFDALKQRELQRRNRRMAAITALALVVMATTSVLAVFALISRHDAVVAQQVAERRQKQAEGLVGFMLGDLNDKLSQVNRLDIMQAVEDKSMAYFRALPSTDVNDTALAQRAKALEQIGSGRMDLGNLPGALDAFRASTTLSSRLAAASPADGPRQIAYSRTLTFIGMVHLNQGKLDEAQRDFESARRVLQSPLAQTPRDPSLLEQLSYLDNDIGHVLESRGQPTEAALEYQRTLGDAQKAVAAKPDNGDLLSNLGDAHNNVGKLALQHGDLLTAIAEYRADDAIETRLAARDPRNNNQRQNMMRVRAILGRTLSLAGETQVGMHDLQQSVDLATQLTQFDPQETTFQEHLALYSSQLARLQRLSGDLRSATASNARAVTILAALSKKDLTNRNWQSEYAEALTEQAAEALAAGNLGAARASSHSALDVLAPMLDQHPNDRGILLSAMTAKLLLASVTPDAAAARNLRSQALQTLQAVKADRGDPRLVALQVEAMLALERKAEAEALLEPLRQSGYRDPALLAALQRAHVEYAVDATSSRKLMELLQTGVAAPSPPTHPPRSGSAR